MISSGRYDAMPRMAAVRVAAWGNSDGRGRGGVKDRHLDRSLGERRGLRHRCGDVHFPIEMLGSLLAVNNPFPFSISGFTGLTTAQIISFFIVFVLFNAYVVLIVIAMVGFYFTSKPRHGVVRTAAIWHFVAVLWMLMAFIGTVWGAPAEKTCSLNTLAKLGVSQRGINAFISMGFAFIAVVCMASASPGSAEPAIREEVLARSERFALAPLVVGREGTGVRASAPSFAQANVALVSGAVKFAGCRPSQLAACSRILAIASGARRTGSRRGSAARRRAGRRGSRW